MNKNEAVSYAQITLDYMLSSKYKGKLSPASLGTEMPFRLSLPPAPHPLLQGQKRQSSRF